MLDEIYNAVQVQKFEDIVVIQTKFNANPRYLILASSNNARHLMNGTEKVNKHFKTSVREAEQKFADLSISNGWNVLDFHSVVLHLFSTSCREQFDIEQLWAVGEDYDDLVNNMQQVPEDPYVKEFPLVFEEDDTEQDNQHQHHSQQFSPTSSPVGLSGLRVPDTGGG